MKENKRGCGCAVTAVIVGLILLVAGALVGWYLLGKYKPSSELADKGKLFGIKSGQVALVLDNELQDTKAIYEDNQVYLPVGWVNEYLNQRFYWDENEKLLVYALPDSIVYADAETMGSSGPLLKVKEDGAYLSLGLVANYTDIRTEAFDTSQIKRVFIDTLWNPVPKVQAKRDGKLRTRGGVKSPIITDVAKGDRLTVLDAMEKWTKVRTEDGYMGYIENRRLEEQEPEPQLSTFKAPVYTNISLGEPVILAFHQVFSQEANNKFEELIDKTEGVNVVVPSWFVMTDNQGNYSSIASRDYVEKAHARGHTGLGHVKQRQHQGERRDQHQGVNGLHLQPKEADRQPDGGCGQLRLRRHQPGFRGTEGRGRAPLRSVYPRAVGGLPAKGAGSVRGQLCALGLHQFLQPKRAGHGGRLRDHHGL